MINIKKVVLTALALCSYSTVTTPSKVLAIPEANGDLQSFCLVYPPPGVVKRGLWSYQVDPGIKLYSYSFVLRAFPSQTVVDITGRVAIVGGTTDPVSSEVVALPSDTRSVAVSGVTFTDRGIVATREPVFSLCR